MSGDGKKTRVDALQAELNRQALVENGKRLAELEKQMWDLEREAEDLKYFSNNTLETAKRLQALTAQIVGSRMMKNQPAKTPADPPKVPQVLPVAIIERNKKKKPER